MAPHSSTPAWKIPWMEEPGRLQSMGSLRVGHYWATSLSCIGEGNGNPLQLPFHSQSTLALRIPGTGEPGGLPSMGSHRVGHDWSDLAAAVGFIGISWPIQSALQLIDISALPWSLPSSISKTNIHGLIPLCLLLESQHTVSFIQRLTAAAAAAAKSLQSYQRPHGLQPTRLLHPWDFPGKSTGVGFHCLLWKAHYALHISLPYVLPSFLHRRPGF